MSDASYAIFSKTSDIFGPFAGFLATLALPVVNYGAALFATMGSPLTAAIVYKSQGGITDRVKDLMAATQHTYVADDRFFSSITSVNRLACAPYAAEAEYNMAVKLWKTDRARSLEYLGRTLHYVEDIAVPHHNELEDNINDIMNTDPYQSSQYKYESGEVEKYSSDGVNFYCDVTTNINDKITLSTPIITSFSIPSLILEEHNIVKQNGSNARYIMYCDGKPKYSICCNEWTPVLSDCQRDAANYANAYFYPQFMNVENQSDFVVGVDIGTCWSGVGYDEDPRRVSQALVPLSAISCTKVLIKFFEETAQPDITPILDLLLGD